jgi:hypothetical protein
MANVTVTSPAPINSTVAAIGAGQPFRDSAGIVYRAVGDSSGGVRSCIRLDTDFVAPLADSTAIQVLIGVDLTFDAA